MVTRLAEEEITTGSQPDEQLSKKLENFVLIEVDEKPVGEYNVIAV